jgi:para-nitrobenzyl esterase
VRSFRGVPFAAPPVDDRRWKPPAPVAPWTGAREATVSGAPCLQRSYGWNAKDAADSREDCLYLDIRTPDLKPTPALPVMVWIHGGANRAGSARGTVESSLVEQGVVLVSIQYRLGAFGFLSHPGLTAEGGGASGNYALMDQIAALRWVRDNIARFGGDPDNVTLFGHSAGGQDVGLLMLAPMRAACFTRRSSRAARRASACRRALWPRTKSWAGPGTRAGGQRPGRPARRLRPGRAGRRRWPEAADRRRRLRLAAGGGRRGRDPRTAGPDPGRRPPSSRAADHRQQRPRTVLYGGAANAAAWVKANYGADAGQALRLYGIDEPGAPSDQTADPDRRRHRLPLPGHVGGGAPGRAGQRSGATNWPSPAPASGAVRHGSELPFVFDTPPARRDRGRLASACRPTGPISPGRRSERAGPGALARPERRGRGDRLHPVRTPDHERRSRRVLPPAARP